MPLVFHHQRYGEDIITFHFSATLCIIKDLPISFVPWDFLFKKLNRLIHFNLSLYMPHFLGICLFILITLHWISTAPHHFWRMVSKKGHTIPGGTFPKLSRMKTSSWHFQASVYTFQCGFYILHDADSCSTYILLWLPDSLPKTSTYTIFLYPVSTI